MTAVTKIIIAAVLAVLLLGLLYVRGCDGRRAIGDQQRIEKGQTGAVLESAQDSSNTQAAVATNDVATADLGRTNEKEIRNAQGSDVVVAPAAQHAGLHALCKRQAYLNRPECRVQ